MTRKQRRGVLIGSGVAILTVAAILVMFALKDSVVFFHTPSDVTEKNIPAGQRIRLGGLVEKGSVKRGEGTAVSFTVTDTLKNIPVTYMACCPISSVRGRASSRKAHSMGAASSRPTEFWPSTTRTTCPRKSRILGSPVA